MSKASAYRRTMDAPAVGRSGNTMTSDDDPETAAAFGERLARLVRSAADQGVDVEGGWEVRDPGSSGKWSVEITRVKGDD